MNERREQDPSLILPKTWEVDYLREVQKLNSETIQEILFLRQTCEVKLGHPDSLPMIALGVSIILDDKTLKARELHHKMTEDARRKYREFKDICKARGVEQEKLDYDSALHILSEEKINLNQDWAIMNEVEFESTIAQWEAESNQEYDIHIGVTLKDLEKLEQDDPEIYSRICKILKIKKIEGDKIEFSKQLSEDGEQKKAHLKFLESFKCFSESYKQWIKDNPHLDVEMAQSMGTQIEKSPAIELTKNIKRERGIALLLPKLANPEIDDSELIEITHAIIDQLLKNRKIDKQREYFIRKKIYNLLQQTPVNREKLIRTIQNLQDD